MLKIILFISIAILVIFLLKRIVGVFVGIAVFLSATFIALFLLDNFTTFDFRSYISTGFYDNTIENPKETAENIKKKSYETGEGAIKRVNDVADDTDYRYGTETEKQKEARLAREKEEKEKSAIENNDNSNENKFNSSNKNQEENLLYEETTKKHFIKYKELDNVLRKQYPNMLQSDIELAHAIMPNLVISYKGKEYNFWNDKEHKDGLFIQKLKEK